MQREIKFRAWSEKHKRMSSNKDVELWNDDGEITGRVFFRLEKGYTSTVYDVNPILMQYTGLKDKNGVEIYEGDIVRAFNSSADYWSTNQVTFKNCCFTIGRYWKDGTHDWYSMEQYDSFELEVIGNIYENPELLNEN